MCMGALAHLGPGPVGPVGPFGPGTRPMNPNWSNWTNRSHPCFSNLPSAHDSEFCRWISMGSQTGRGHMTNDFRVMYFRKLRKHE